MTGTTLSSAELDGRRRKALYRSWHRGMRETDLLLGRFADGHVATMDEDELSAFEQVLDRLDSDLMSWITGEAIVPPEVDGSLIACIRAYAST